MDWFTGPYRPGTAAPPLPDLRLQGTGASPAVGPLQIILMKKST